MSKKPIITNLDDIENVPEVVKEKPADITSSVHDFMPTLQMRRAKSLAMAKMMKFPTGITLLDSKQAYELTGIREVKDWWKNPRFVDWFTNDASHINRVDYLLFRQLDFLEEILDGTEPISVKDRLAAGKQILEMRRELQASGMSEEEKQRIIQQLLNAENLIADNDNPRRIERGAGSVMLPEGDDE